MDHIETTGETRPFRRIEIESGYLTDAIRREARTNLKMRSARIVFLARDVDSERYTKEDQSFLLLFKVFRAR